MNFERAFEKLMGHEGDFVDHPKDPGGATRYGITQRMADPHKLAARFNGHRLRFLTDLKTWPTFGRGWARRVADNLMGA